MTTPARSPGTRSTSKRPPRSPPRWRSGTRSGARANPAGTRAASPLGLPSRPRLGLHLRSSGPGDGRPEGPAHLLQKGRAPQPRHDRTAEGNLQPDVPNPTARIGPPRHTHRAAQAQLSLAEIDAAICRFIHQVYNLRRHSETKTAPQPDGSPARSSRACPTASNNLTCYSSPSPNPARSAPTASNSSRWAAASTRSWPSTPAKRPPSATTPGHHRDPRLPTPPRRQRGVPVPGGLQRAVRTDRRPQRDHRRPQRPTHTAARPSEQPLRRRRPSLGRAGAGLSAEVKSSSPSGGVALSQLARPGSVREAGRGSQRVMCRTRRRRRGSSVRWIRCRSCGEILPAGQHGVLDPRHQAAPEVGADEDDRERGDLLRLDERDGVQAPVQGAEAAGRTLKACEYLTNTVLRTRPTEAPCHRQMSPTRRTLGP
ncbi:hypothetical protein DFJ69_6002 [Thermomonospora umbrina]|uniref:Uncharacterized protein n=1 Tax=Thermomonospora umbrina TaxID=111806 RepID=A0A3D9T282_9ACTN|nr:hypothetical protein DFJ69_6002 [Thermomonospora umbrina]